MNKSDQVPRINRVARMELAENSCVGWVGAFATQHLPRNVGLQKDATQATDSFPLKKSIHTLVPTKIIRFHYSGRDARIPAGMTMDK